MKFLTLFVCALAGALVGIFVGKSKNDRKEVFELMKDHAISGKRVLIALVNQGSDEDELDPKYGLAPKKGKGGTATA